jgi:hypothetical protein
VNHNEIENIYTSLNFQKVNENVFEMVKKFIENNKVLEALCVLLKAY